MTDQNDPNHWLSLICIACFWQFDRLFLAFIHFWYVFIATAGVLFVFSKQKFVAFSLNCKKFVRFVKFLFSVLYFSFLLFNFYLFIYFFFLRYQHKALIFKHGHHRYMYCMYTKIRNFVYLCNAIKFIEKKNVCVMHTNVQNKR